MSKIILSKPLLGKPEKYRPISVNKGYYTYDSKTFIKAIMASNLPSEVDSEIYYGYVKYHGELPRQLENVVLDTLFGFLDERGGEVLTTLMKTPDVRKEVVRLITKWIEDN